MFQPTEEIVIKLTVQEWNQILMQLQDGPWKTVNPLIGKISSQAQAATTQGQYTNGEVAEQEVSGQTRQ